MVVRPTFRGAMSILSDFSANKLVDTVQIFTKNSKKNRMRECISLALATEECEGASSTTEEKEKSRISTSVACLGKIRPSIRMTACEWPLLVGGADGLLLVGAEFGQTIGQERFQFFQCD